MEYLKAVNLLKEIEQKYNVMSIKYKAVSVWPQLRIYLISNLATHGETALNASTAKLIFSSLLYYNPFIFFRKYDIWHFNSCITRKKVGNKFVHHVSGFLPQICPNTLQWEAPIPDIRHYPKKEIDEQNIISSSWWIILSRGLSFLSTAKKLHLENEDLINQILVDYNISFDYRACVNRLIWLKRTADFFFAVGRKPKLIIIECAYTQMGLVWSAHNHGIPVVELQHGVLNEHHYGYNPAFHSRELYPDEICVYGDVEYKYFTDHSKQYSKITSIMGMYMLECADNYFNKDIFEEYRKKYTKVVVVAGETGLEDLLSSFIDRVANDMADVMFMYLPRRPEPGIKFASKNVKYCYGVNIYEYLKWCDVHCTITSTTCLEAHYFHKPTIFLNFENRSINYYEMVLDGAHGGFYINTEVEFIKVFKEIDDTNISFKEIFAHNHQERMRGIIEKYLI